MVQLNHGQFLGSTFLKWKYNSENNLRVKQQLSPQMSNDTCRVLRDRYQVRPRLRRVRYDIV